MSDIFDQIREAGEQISKNISDMVEDFKKQINEAYQKGYDAGIIASSFVDKSDEAYQRGFEDGKNSIDKGCEGCRYESHTDHVEPCCNCCNEYYSQYEPMPKDEICFGDEIVVNGERGVVVSHENEGSAPIWAPLNGYRTPQIVDKNNYAKTGRRFDISSILEAMKNE